MINELKGRCIGLLAGAVLGALLISGAAPTGAAPLDRAKIVLSSAIAVDPGANTVTLPLYRGTAHGATVWYIKTDVSDASLAKEQGLLYAPGLSAAGDGAQIAKGDSSSFTFSGSVDFSPERKVTTGPGGAPMTAKPGSVGDAQYSPFVRAGGVVYNAPIVASGDHPSDVTHHTDTLDNVVAIDTSDPKRAHVTLVLVRGFDNGQPIEYISTDSSDEGTAAVGRMTFAPRLAKAAKTASPIYAFLNGRSDGEGQGVGFAAVKGHLTADASPANAAMIGSPLNITATFPGVNGAPSGYSPLWSAYPAVWTPAALHGGKAHRLTSIAAVGDAVKAGLVTGPDGKPFGPAGVFVNCPDVVFLQERP